MSRKISTIHSVFSKMDRMFNSWISTISLSFQKQKCIKFCMKNSRSFSSQKKAVNYTENTHKQRNGHSQKMTWNMKVFSKFLTEKLRTKLTGNSVVLLVVIA